MIRIVIAEDQEFLLGIIGSLLNLEDDMEVVGQSSERKEILTLVEKLQPDICLMDTVMHSKEGFSEELRTAGCKLLILSTFPEKGYFEKIINMDVRGYLPKDSSSEEFVSSIRLILDGGRIYSPELMEGNQDGALEEAAPSPAGLDTPQRKQNGKTIESVRGYFSAFKDKMKLPAG
ncbi:DNA-binding response regulator [Bacillus salacetis]|uniref:DNA-binding response regulator n=1 Tax=Bacillus salacetis TaxID=2315464 RepID=A0A3A1QQA2_9BACI|nr:response regulator [Bacillus salacetis]RIW28452.1 DNA-binding response regulator [Bacillus salacetis]